VGTVTGRISSNNPNLQNIPIRTEEGRRVRKAFIASPGWFLVGADYSQVELRVMAHVSQDKGLCGAFDRDEDVHATTAAAVFDIPIEEVTYDLRRIAKAVNFGLIYGQSAFGLARQIGVDVDEAQKFINRYFDRFPLVKKYMNRMEEEAITHGFVETLMKRRRYFPQLSSAGYGSANQRQAAQRMAINTPIQGSAADIIKLAMIRLHEMLNSSPLRGKMLLQVHDEIVLEVPEDELHDTKLMIRQAMENAFDLVVPLKVDIEVGSNWLEME
jgi:DNA polymerase-1